MKELRGFESGSDRSRPSGFEPLYQRCCAVLSRRSLKYLKWAVVLTSPVLTISAILLAPRYLAYAEPPRQSDAVILFIGSDNDARLREARQLIADGYAGHLLIPAFNQVMKVDSSFPLPSPQRIEDTACTKRMVSKRKDFPENTHTEVLVAMQMMKRLDFRTAILVSSPYHMRRIKIIAERVFTNSPSLSADPPVEKGTLHQRRSLAKGGRADLNSVHASYRLHFVPTRYKSTQGAFWLATCQNLQWVVTEYLKIAWFQLYTHFASDPDV